MDESAASLLVHLVDALEPLHVVDALWVGGSLATGDYVARVSDIDLVAVTAHPLATRSIEAIARLHAELDAGVGRGMDLGCQYVDVERLHDVSGRHPTWTHGVLTERDLSLVTRAELSLHGFSLVGPPPRDLLPPVSHDQVRAAAQAELDGYWTYASRRPLLLVCEPTMVDLGLTAMARGRHAVRTGKLLTKTEAISRLRAPDWLVEQIRRRRAGQAITSPQLRAGLIAWWDVLRTTSGFNRFRPERDRLI